MRFVIVTGMSGAGKSTALKMLEDAEYFCVDNLPIPLVEKFAQLTADGTSGEIQKVAVGIDIRSGQALPDLQNVLEWMSINGICYEILFLDASDDVLVKRYKETRRTHPLAGLGRVDEGIRKERKALEFLKKDADYILDTSQLLRRRGQVPHRAGAQTAHGGCRQQRQRPESGEQPLCPRRSGTPPADDRR